MSKIYVALRGWSYEDSEIISAHSTREGAERACDRDAAGFSGGVPGYIHHRVEETDMWILGEDDNE